jgi:hypothetical protein
MIALNSQMQRGETGRRGAIFDSGSIGEQMVH